jgi:hypothetical protein
MGQRATDGESIRLSPKPVADDVGDPELPLSMADEADQRPRHPRQRKLAGIGQASKE